MSKRPKLRDKAIIKVAAMKLFDDVATWLTDSGDNTDFENQEEKDKLLEQLVNAIDSALDTDGYALAKELENSESWSPDARLVEIMDVTSTHLRSALRIACVAWWKEQSITPYPAGTRVKAKTVHGDETKGKVGTILEFQEDGRYTVNFYPDLNHKDPKDLKGSGISGRVLEHELLEPVP